MTNAKLQLETQLDLLKTGTVDIKFLEPFSKEIAKELFGQQDSMSINEIVNRVNQMKIKTEGARDSMINEIQRVSQQKIQLQNQLIEFQAQERQFEQQLQMATKKLDLQMKQLS